MKIKTKVARLHERIKDLHTQLKLIQEDCPHNEDIQYKYCGSKGYDYSNYWIDFKCNDCGKVWSTPQDWEYRQYILSLGKSCKEVSK